MHDRLGHERNANISNLLGAANTYCSWYDGAAYYQSVKINPLPRHYTNRRLELTAGSVNGDISLTN